MQSPRAAKRRAVAAVILLLLSLGCSGGPFLIFPGGVLTGEIVTEAPPDWSFAGDAFVHLETRPGQPYSVELNYVVTDGQLFVDPADGRVWLDYIRDDPRVRVRFAGRIYPATAVLVGTPGELEEFPDDRFVYRLDFRIP